MAATCWQRRLFAALNVVPVVLLVRQSLLARTGPGNAVEWYPPGLLTAWLTGFGLVAAAVTFVFFGGPQGMQAALREVLAPALDRRLGEITPELDELLAFVAFILPRYYRHFVDGDDSDQRNALPKACWPASERAGGHLPISRRSASRCGSRCCSPLLSGATLLGGTARFIGVNVLIVLAVPFCLAGLAVLHTVARRFPRPAVTLTVFYLLAGVLGWPLLLIALLGLLDSPLGLRRRFA